jgi:DNA-binding transcriptional LysR family regulator
MDKLSGMAVFARVVEAKGFSAAAAQLGLSKSAVSKQVSRLEDRLGARLLNRTTRTLALTEVGRIFYEHCARMLAEAEEAEQAVLSLHAAPRGLLRINVPMSFGVMHIAPALPLFLARYPEMAIEMDMTDRFVDLVEDGYDLAVRIASLPESSLIARRLAPNRAVVCAAPDYLARHGEPRRPADLAAHNCLLYTNTPLYDQWRFDGPEGKVAVAVAGSLRANNGEALLQAALAGVGITRAPTFMASTHLCAGRLRAVLTDYQPVAESAIYAVYPHRRHLTPKVRAFVEFLAAHIGQEPHWDCDIGLA